MFFERYFPPNELTPLRKILSTTVNLTHNLEKLLVSILPDIAQNQFTIKDSFSFVGDFSSQYGNLDMSSLNAGFFITNILSNKTIDMRLKKHVRNPKTLFT